MKKIVVFLLSIFCLALLSCSNQTSSSDLTSRESVKDIKTAKLDSLKEFVQTTNLPITHLSSFLKMASDSMLTISSLQTAPTDIQLSKLRGGQGVYNAPRGGGRKHTGVDIVSFVSSIDENDYRVMAVKGGKVAYNRINGGTEEGYGYTVVIDHGDGSYSLYAHLAETATTRLGLNVGDNVTQGQTIGFLSNLTEGDFSTGNVRSSDVPRLDKIQVHFETFLADQGRSSTGAISTIKQGCVYLDPTSDLVDIGYKSFDF